MSRKRSTAASAGGGSNLHEGHPLAQEIVEIHEATNLLANCPHLVVGLRGSTFEFKRPNDEKTCAAGEVMRLGEQKEPAMFFLYPKDKNSTEKAVNMAIVSSKLRINHHLRVNLVSLDQKKQNCVLCYDNFNNFFSQWIVMNPREPFTVDNGPLSDWWKATIRNILSTLDFMGREQLFHGNLKEDSSYVMIGEMLYLIGAEIDGSMMSEVEVESKLKNDLEGLKFFLNKYVTSTFTSVDWTKFMEMFDIASVTFGQLKKHPVLMDSDERFKYFRDIAEYIRYTKQPIRIKQTINTDTAGVEFYNWNFKIVNPVMLGVFKFGGSSYITTEVCELLRFIRNLLEHCNDHAKRSKLPKYSIAGIEKEVSDTYVGFLSYLHDCLVRCHPNLSITSE